jgi:succinoglycan biosynthesis transport protein ExoP
LDDTVRATVDTQSLVNLPTLAKIGQLNGKENDNKLIALENPLSPETDSFRMHRMNLQSVSSWQSLRTILFTSVEPSVGKSLTISNLAIVMAQFGNRVILVDADLRKPAIHRYFGIKNEGGIKDLLVNIDMNVSSCLQKTQLANLKILTCGSGEFSSMEVLGSGRMKVIIQELNSQADVVLIDSPPALMFTDSYLIGKLVSGMIIVSRTGKTRTELLKKLVNDLRMAGINMLGVVIQVRGRNDMYTYDHSKYYSESKKGNKKFGLSLKTRENADDLTMKHIK